MFQLDKGMWPIINGCIGVPHLVGNIVACHLVQAHGIIFLPNVWIRQAAVAHRVEIASLESR